MSKPTLVERLYEQRRIYWKGSPIRIIHILKIVEEAANHIVELEGKLLRETKLSLKQYKQVQDLLNEKTLLNARIEEQEADIANKAILMQRRKQGRNSARRKVARLNAMLDRLQQDIPEVYAYIRNRGDSDE